MDQCSKCGKEFSEKEEILKCRYCPAVFHIQCVPFGQEQRWQCEKCKNYNYKGRNPFTIINNIILIFRKGLAPLTRKLKKKRENE